MTLNHLIYVLSIVCGAIIIVSPKISHYIIGVYLIAFGVIKLVMVLS